MQCRSALTKIDAKRTGELPERDRGELEEHLRTCASCDDSLHDVELLARAARTLTVAPPRSCRAMLCDRFDAVEVDGERVWVAFSDRGLTMIHAGGSEEEFRSRYCDRLDRGLEPDTLPEKLARQVSAALTGAGVDKPAVDFGEATEFERAVLEILTRIPRGEVRTYSWVAQQAGRPGAIRAVGNICARNVLPFVVPCHRVVPTSGGIGNYAFGSPMKKELLSREGVPVESLLDLGRRGIRYIGSKTTRIFCFPTCRDALRIREDNRVDFRDAGDAAEKGFRPCRRCQPVAA